MYKYLHDEENKIVYRLPVEPDVIEQKNKSGRRSGWGISMQILITRADNTLNQNRWQHPTSSNPRQEFDAHYERGSAISYFFIHHTPVGNEVSQEAYESLHRQYETIAINK